MDKILIFDIRYWMQDIDYRILWQVSVVWRRKRGGSIREISEIICSQAAAGRRACGNKAMMTDGDRQWKGTWWQKLLLLLRNQDFCQSSRNQDCGSIIISSGGCFVSIRSQVCQNCPASDWSWKTGSVTSVGVQVLLVSQIPDSFSGGFTPLSFNPESSV